MPTSTATPTPTPTGTAAPPTLTATLAPSATPASTSTATATATATDTATPAATATATDTATPAATATATATALATGPALTAISSDPFTPSVPGQHASEVEPDTFAYSSTVVAAFQVGRFYDGGSTTNGWATRQGGTWQSGLLPGLTKNETPAGPYDRVSDASVAYDAAHGVWLISSLAIKTDASNNVVGAGVIVSRSPDGVTWGGASGTGPPYFSTVATIPSGASYYDKDWIVCDDTATSPYYGHCYAEWDDAGQGDLFQMSTSTDGGKTWGAPVTPAGSPHGLGGQPLVQPNGTVIVPATADYADAISFRSTDGGRTWGDVTTISPTNDHTVAGNLRTEPLPSAEIDGAGTVYDVWQGCQFEPGCAANDIVLVTSTNGLTWTSPLRIPIDSVGSGVDHFIPGLAVNPATSGAGAHLALTYYYYPKASCGTSSTPACQLDVGFISSTDGGRTWSAPRQLAGPMQLGWLPATNQGVMVGDYISTSFAGDAAVPVFAVAQAPSGSILNQAMYSTQLSINGG